MLLDKKRIFIVGGCSGMGKATAIKCLREGARVTILDFASQEVIDATKKELGEKCYIIQGSVANSKDVDRALDYAVEMMGGLDGAMNNSAGTRSGRITDLTDEDFEKSLQMGLYSFFYCVRREGLIMKENGGSIVNISSLNSNSPAEGQVTYNCAKAAVDMLTRTAALEYGKWNIRVNAIRPGMIATPAVKPLMEIPQYNDFMCDHTPLGKFGTSEDIGNTVAFLLSDECTYMTGSVIAIDGGIEQLANPNTLIGRQMDVETIYREAMAKRMGR